MNTTPDLIHLSPHDLSIHPSVADFPGLSEDQLGALNLSVKEHGILTHITADRDHRVYDGRALLAVAQALDMSTVPVLIRAEEDVLGYAIESRIVRGHLTRSGISFLLFEQHPEGSKAGRPKKLAGNQPISGKELASYRDLALRYRVPREHFTQLAEMCAKMSPEEWQELRNVVLFGEASIPRQFAGFCTGLPAGSKRGAVIYASVDDQGVLEGILPRAFSSLRQGFARWETEINSQAKAAIEKDWENLLESAPAELLKIAVRKGARRG